VQSDLLYDVGDIRLSERQVLESTCNSPKLSDILYKRPEVCSKLLLEVDRSHERLAVSHDRALDDVQCVGVLVKRPGVFHSKLPL
jgi:hypothetical protein